ncbi:MAG TPA: septation protein SepH, partial [Lapillicoccus sp.]|nr:septation protein SepH [Lapillicoccus sp.]
MQDLRLIGVQDDGEHLLLAGPDGTHFRLALDEPLRAAARRDRPRLGQLQIEIDGGMRPREVQSLIRAGASAEEVADRAGWTVEKVGRYEGPILAERVHVADQARLVRVRSRGGATGSTVPTLQGRVAQRMRERGVDPESSVWDAWRGVEETLWTVVLTFAAGGRQRQAAWTYDPVLRTVEAADDEARWLSADEPTSMGPLPTSTPRVTNVYDVEAEGGVAASTRRAAAAARAGQEEEPLDLMTAMRQRTTVGRRSGRRRAASAEPARRETTPALPIDTAPQAAATVEPATPTSEVHAEDPVEPTIEAGFEPTVEPALEPVAETETPLTEEV